MELFQTIGSICGIISLLIIALIIILVAYASKQDVELMEKENEQ